MMALVVLALAAAPAVHRAALIVGANEAPAGRGALRYAHRDAMAVREVLMRVGGVAERDAVMLLDPTPDAVSRALRELAGGFKPSDERVVYFYYSGHADDDALYPGGEALPIAKVRADLAQLPATVRIGIIDACRGGSWTRAKGLTLKPPVDVTLPNLLRAEGTVLFASSSGFEEAHESDALQASFFTHHLVAGMSGAADASGDGVVTAHEVFTYAQRLTVRDSAGAHATPQHPSFEMNLRGRQDLELTRMAMGPATLALRQRVGPLQLVQLPAGLVLLELPEGPRETTVAVAPGGYLVRRVSNDGVVGAREVKAVEGVTLPVDEASLVDTMAPARGSKGVELPPRTQFSTLEAGRISVGLAGGVSYNPRQLLDSSGLRLEGYDLSPAAMLRLHVSFFDWLELTPLQAGAAVRFGSRGAHEGVVSVGLDGWSVGNVNSNALPAAALAWRFWATPSTSVVTWARARVAAGWAVEAPSRSPVAGLTLLGGGFLTHTFREVISVNVGVSGAHRLPVGPPESARPSYTGVTVGGGLLGNRVFPLLQVHLSPVWTVDFDMDLTATVWPTVQLSQTFMAGFSATW